MPVYVASHIIAKVKLIRASLRQPQNAGIYTPAARLRQSGLVVWRERVFARAKKYEDRFLLLAYSFERLAPFCLLVFLLGAVPNPPYLAV